MSLPEVKIIKATGGLGRPAANLDGVAALCVSGVAATGIVLGDVLGPFYNLSAVEAAGITAAYDATNLVSAHKHCKDFYNEAGEGAELYVVVSAKTADLITLIEDTGVIQTKLIPKLNGRLRLIGITSNAAAGNFFAQTTPTDIVLTAQQLAEWAFDTFRPVSLIIEGSGFNNTAVPDLRSTTGPNANRVAVMVGSDYEYTQSVANFSGVAAVGAALGRLAAIAVNRNLGRVKDGAVAITKAGYSSNKAVGFYSESDVAALDDKGYIFFRTITGKAGYFFNNSHVACPISDDSAYLERGRVLDKAARIVRGVYVDELLNDIEIDPATGKIPADVAKAFQQACDQALNINMSGEVSGAKTYVDTDQDVLATDKVEIKLKVVPHGLLKEIEVTLGFSKTLE